ncbi:oxidoreductase [Mycobacterium tuberculosis EAS054]|nr:oxidoreductase [Mycobacterium tuberculosis EAS054]
MGLRPGPISPCACNTRPRRSPSRCRGSSATCCAGHRHRGHPHRRVALYGRADHLPDRGRRRDRTAPLYAGGRGGGRHGRAAAPCPHRQRATATLAYGALGVLIVLVVAR